MIDWLFTNALVALALAAIAGTLIWTFRPAPAVRHALWLVVVLKLVLPAGPTVWLPIDVDPPKVEQVVAERLSAPIPDTVVEAEIFTIVVNPRPGQTVEEAAALAVRGPEKIEDTATVEPELALAPVATVQPPAKPFNYRPWLLAAWVAGALYFGWRQLRETYRFHRFARNARSAPDSLVAEVAIVANRLGVRIPNVRTLAGLTSPVMWCLGRPVLLWPAGLECRLKGEGRRAVIAHELAHLRRRDHWVRRLEMVAAVLHWWNPLFWIARRKMRADAELACDAWATGQADRRAYAEALLEVCSFNPRRRPAPAVGVFGEGRRAMQERLTMIMRDRVPCRLAFGAKLVVALMAVAAIPAWTLGQSKPEVVFVDDVFVYEVAEEKGVQDVQVKEIEAHIKALMQKLEALKAVKKAEAEKTAADKLKAANVQLGEKAKELELTLKGVVGKDFFMEKTQAAPQGVKVMIAGQDGVRVIGPDGKELKDVKVIIGHLSDPTVTTPVYKSVTVTGTAPEGKFTKLGVATPETGNATSPPAAKPLTATWTTGQPAQAIYARTAGQASGNSITLSRATYKLNKEQAAALSTLLGSIKATVMETKVDGDNITVTTTPEAQAAIGQIVHLVQGQSGNLRFEWKVAQPAPSLNLDFTPIAPAAPTPPTPAIRVTPVAPPAVAAPVAPVRPATPAKPAVPATPAKPTAEGTPTKVNVNDLIERALKLKGKVDDAGGDLDLAKLQELLKTLKPLEFKVELDNPKPAPKPAPAKKPTDPGM